MHLWRNAVVLAFALALSCDGDKDDDTNGGGDEADADADTDADGDADTDADTDLPKSCTPENVCRFSAETAQCKEPPLNGKECVTWYMKPENCPNVKDVGDKNGMMDEVLGCECACMPKDGGGDDGPPEAAPTDPCECMYDCLETFCPPPKK